MPPPQPISGMKNPITSSPLSPWCSVCEMHDPTGEPSAGNRHAGFGERGLETRPWEPDCGPERKRRTNHRTLKLARQSSTLLRRGKVLSPSGCEPRPATVAPAGSNRSG